MLGGVKSELQGSANLNGADKEIPSPISDILRVQSNGVYPQILTFLLQIHRTKYLLDYISRVALYRERKGLTKDANIIHVVRFELLWFVKTLLHHFGVVVRFIWICG